MSEPIYTGKLEYVVGNVLLLVREHFARTGALPGHPQDTTEVMRHGLPLLPIGSVT